ncbi:MAG: hypothetical protein ACYTGB_06610 [Planctomycetota bacterium]|jgi:hypothetical protein
MAQAATGKLTYKRAVRGTHIDNLRKRAGAEVQAYLKSLNAPKPGADTDARVATLIKDLGSADFGTREKASKGLVAVGKPALERLKKAMKDADPEVSSRAEMAVQEIEGGEIITRLQSYSLHGRIVVDVEQRKAEKEAESIAGKLAAAEKSGDAGDLDARRAALAAARKRADALAALQKKLSAPGRVVPRVWGGVGGGVLVR